MTKIINNLLGKKPVVLITKIQYINIKGTLNTMNSNVWSKKLWLFDSVIAKKMRMS